MQEVPFNKGCMIGFSIGRDSMIYEFMIDSLSKWTEEGIKTSLSLFRPLSVHCSFKYSALPHIGRDYMSTHDVTHWIMEWTTVLKPELALWALSHCHLDFSG